jgi:hypothetical protein
VRGFAMLAHSCPVMRQLVQHGRVVPSKLDRGYDDFVSRPYRLRRFRRPVGQLLVWTQRVNVGGAISFVA